jgi:hypothetical protein
MRQPRKLTPSLSLSLALPLAALAAAGCSLNPVPLDPNDQRAPDCTGAAIPLIACAVGETVPVCTRDSAGRSRWTITCPGQADAGPITEPEPTTTSVNLQLQNGGAAAAYVYQGCLIDFTITALTDPPVTINRVEGCVCECGRNDCPTCGACYAGPLEIPAGGQVTQSWLTANVTSEPGGVRGSCQRLHGLPAGSYRIELPVYATQAEAAAKVLPRVVTQVFALPAPNDTVAIPFSLATGAP